MLEEIERFREEQKQLILQSEKLKGTYQDQLNQLFVSLDSEQVIHLNRNYTFEQVITEAKRIQIEVEQLKRENWKLKRKLDGYGSDEGPEIEEVD